jgi:hypothetical protein
MKTNFRRPVRSTLSCASRRRVARPPLSGCPCNAFTRRRAGRLYFPYPSSRLCPKRQVDPSFGSPEVCVYIGLFCVSALPVAREAGRSTNLHGCMRRASPGNGGAPTLVDNPVALEHAPCTCNLSAGRSAEARTSFRRACRTTGPSARVLPRRETAGQRQPTP